MTPCLPIEELADVAGFAPNDVRRTHVESCARCSALVASYNEFMRGQVVVGSDPADAGQRLAEVIATRVEGDDRATSPGVAPPGRRFLARSTVRPVWGGAAALAIVLAVAIVRWHPWLPDPTVLRGVAGAGIAVEAPQREGDSWRVAWPPVAGAGYYVVSILAADMSEILRLDPTTDTAVLVDAASIPAAARAGTLYWRVTALDRGDPIAESSPDPLPRR